MASFVLPDIVLVLRLFEHQLQAQCSISLQEERCFGVIRSAVKDY